jgi:hypothetical protein
MSRLLRTDLEVYVTRIADATGIPPTHIRTTDLDELDAYATRVAEATGIPGSHVEKDVWVTEVRLGTSATSSDAAARGHSGATRACRRPTLSSDGLSEDLDLIAVLPAGGKPIATTPKAFVEGFAAATGIHVGGRRCDTTEGMKRTSIFRFPTAHDSGMLRSGVRMAPGATPRPAVAHRPARPSMRPTADPDSNQAPIGKAVSRSNT